MEETEISKQATAFAESRENLVQLATSYEQVGMLEFHAMSEYPGSEARRYQVLRETMDEVTKMAQNNGTANRNLTLELIDLQLRIGKHTERIRDGKPVVEKGIVADGISGKEFIMFAAELGHTMEQTPDFFQGLEKQCYKNHGLVDAETYKSAEMVVEGVGVSRSDDNFNSLVDGISYLSSIQAAHGEKMLQKYDAAAIAARYTEPPICKVIETAADNSGKNAMGIKVGI